MQANLRTPGNRPNFDLVAEPEEELIALAGQRAFVLPLIAYPRWRFDEHWENPDLVFQFRRGIWERFRDKLPQTPLLLGWHHGLTLELFLGNDISVLAYCAGCYEPNQLAFIGRFLVPGMRVLDAGANEGIYTTFCAVKVGASGRIWAVEPSERELGRLRRNVAINALDQMSSHALVLIPSHGEEDLIAANSRRLASSSDASQCEC